MKLFSRGLPARFLSLLVLALGLARPAGSLSQNAAGYTGPFTDFRGERPGRVHRITAADLPPTYATKSAAIFSAPIPRPADGWPKAPDGFQVDLYAAGLNNPRLIRTAPNGDIFLAESDPGKILVFRGVAADGKAARMETFATGLHRPFGIAFYPLGTNPQYIYIGNTDSVVRFPYVNGDLKARGPEETVIAKIPSGDERVGGGGHWTRDVTFSLDGKTLFVSVGSRTNITNSDKDKSEALRADILAANPDGSALHVYASGIRNPVGIAVDPHTGVLWTSVNERDDLGDDLPPDYITHVEEGGFYGWPWYYIGGNEDPRLAGKHPELKDKVIVPDVLLEPHDASLELAFYEGQQFPEQYQGSIFAAEHGSWNRSVRTGYEVVFVPAKNGRAMGEYQDFLTGFVNPQGECWGRPVGVAVAQDGSLMVTDDGSQSLWRVHYAKK